MTQQANTPPVNTSQTQEDEIDLGRLLGLLLEGKWIIIAITFVAAVLGVSYALLATPEYKANALLQVEEKSGGMAALGDMGEMFSQSSNAEAEINIISSRHILGAAIDEVKRDIQVAPKRFPIVGGFVARRHSEPQVADASLFTSYAWGGEQINVSQFNVPNSLLDKGLTLRTTEQGFELLDEDEEVLVEGEPNQLANNNGITILVTDLQARPNTEFTITKVSTLRAINSLNSALSVSEKGKASGILELALTGTDQKDIANTLNAVAQQYLLQNVRRQSAEAEKSLEFLSQQQPELKAKLDQAEERLNQYRQQNKSVDLGLETQSVLTRLVDLEKQLNELSFKESELSRLYTRSHPSYQALLEKKQSLLRDKNELSDKVENLPNTQQEILRLTRDMEVSQEIYIQLLNKVQELNIVKAGTVGNVRIIDDAVTALAPVKPKKPLIAILATLLGGMLGVGIVLLRGLLNRGVENPEDFEQVGINVYASVPLSVAHEKKMLSFRKRKAKQQSDMLLADYNPTDLAIESLRALRTSLHFAMLEASNNIIAIGGPSPSVGKSFISANLAAICAQSGQKVLVIDADLRKGYMHTIFEQTVDSGLSSLLSGKNTLPEVIKPTQVGNLHFMARGQVPPNPSELLMHSNFKQLLDKVSQDYDLVIVDTPPILAVTDPVIVSAQAGTTLMVSRFAKNPLKEVEVAQRRYEQNGITVKGIVFNAVERKASSYGYGNYGYYNYEYKS
ncbi:polysaccharide biosynthesis tyrosine autokinase [Oceanisphaera pacifica]|uniref:Polysaccharide biosynthesis tyrosine autokinase n=1 Tax=Oceanisphaera pacifica TaxID=2818389 RepID=A0ABS3NGN6_9GAMM|nr:polysaccharide biosynthesis tyrosine autokinase [Oceanisphaera pacifica]MBO1519710.1 polysaccharide biosynthesis tyrosine autokinase [Oceanisphaera pacifica]